MVVIFDSYLSFIHIVHDLNGDMVFEKHPSYLSFPALLGHPIPDHCTLHFSYEGQKLDISFSMSSFINEDLMGSKKVLGYTDFISGMHLTSRNDINQHLSARERCDVRAVCLFEYFELISSPFIVDTSGDSISVFTARCVIHNGVVELGSYLEIVKHEVLIKAVSVDSNGHYKCILFCLNEDNIGAVVGKIVSVDQVRIEITEIEESDVFLLINGFEVQ